MSTPDIFLIGPEGSGHHMMRRLLLWHPDVERTLGSSYPHGIPEKCEYPNLLECDPQTTVALFLCRDHTCQRASIHRRNFPQERARILRKAAWEFNSPMHVMTVIEAQLDAWQGRVVWCSYETMVMWRARYLRHILIQLGLDPDKYPYDKVAIKDANAKYWNDIHVHE